MRRLALFRTSAWISTRLMRRYRLLSTCFDNAKRVTTIEVAIREGVSYNHLTHEDFSRGLEAAEILKTRSLHAVRGPDGPDVAEQANWTMSSIGRTSLVLGGPSE